jgi:hypothetical protein
MAGSSRRKTDTVPVGVAEQLDYHVYLLIDPPTARRSTPTRASEIAA